MLPDLDLIIDVAAARYGRRSDIPAALVGASAQMKQQRMPAWSREEDDFLRRNLGVLSEEMIAFSLGRSEHAVHLRWERELHIPAPSKDLRYITAHQAAKDLGVEGHAMTYWCDAGLVPSRRMAGERAIRLIRRITFHRWAVNPENWVYFDPDAVRDEHLARLIALKKARWGDEWWRTTQVAEYHGVTVQDVKRYISLGRIKAVRPEYSIGGRNLGDAWRWNFVLKSEATRPDIVFYKLGKGSPAQLRPRFTPRADGWILRARDELHLEYEAIARTMKINDPRGKSVRYRYCQLKEAGNG